MVAAIIVAWVANKGNLADYEYEMMFDEFILYHGKDAALAAWAGMQPKEQIIPLKKVPPCIACVIASAKAYPFLHRKAE